MKKQINSQILCYLSPSRKQTSIIHLQKSPNGQTIKPSSQSLLLAMRYNLWALSEIKPKYKINREGKKIPENTELERLKFYWHLGFTSTSQQGNTLWLKPSMKDTLGTEPRWLCQGESIVCLSSNSKIVKICFFKKVKS